MGAYVDGAWSGIGKTVQRIEQFYIDIGNGAWANNADSNVMTPDSKQYH